MSQNKGGRSRSEGAREAILAATRQLLVERGYDRLTIEGVAALAGVGKQTIYRWWGSKSALVAEYVTHDDTLVADAGVPDTGDLQADLESWLEDAIARSNSQPTAGLLRGLVAAAAEDSSVAENLFASLSGRAEQALIARVRQAKPVSAETARITVAAITGAIIYALLTNRPLPEGSAAVLAGLIDGGLSRE